MAQRAIDARQRAEQIAAGLPPLLVAARRVANTVMQGIHGRRQPGPGETFWQFRRYQAGDPASLIDWRQSAKSTPLYVREQEWEAAQSVWLWRDCSPSMAYASKGMTENKAERATLLMLATAALLLEGGEQVALLGTGRRPARGVRALDRLASMTLAESAAGASLPPRELLPRYGQIVLIGDLLSPLEEIEAIVRFFSGRGILGHLLQVLDPAEETLPFTGRARMIGMEDEGSTLIGKVESVRAAYYQRLEAQRAGLVAIARATNWTFIGHRTDRPPETALLALYLALSGNIGRRR